jgi:hypothetical protein
VAAGRGIYDMFEGLKEIQRMTAIPLNPPFKKGEKEQGKGLGK